MLSLDQDPVQVNKLMYDLLSIPTQPECIDKLFAHKSYSNTIRLNLLIFSFIAVNPQHTSLAGALTALAYPKAAIIFPYKSYHDLRTFS